jgi:hypothetical protein
VILQKRGHKPRAWLLKDTTWELEPEKLARALSAKTHKENTPCLSIAEFEDKMEHYNIEIDKVNQVLNVAHQSFNPHKLGDKKTITERDHYEPLCGFMEVHGRCIRGLP